MSFWDTLKEAIKETFKPVEIVTSIFPSIGAAGAPVATQATRTAAATPQGQAVKQKFVEQVTPGIEAITTPYRELVAEPITAGLIEGPLAGAREFVEGLPGDLGIEESEYAQYISPGQALVGRIGTVLPGKQAVDKIDFKNAEEVRNFFSKGAPKFWSGFSDFGFTLGLDPFLVAGKAASAARVGLVIRPIKNEKDLLRASAESDAAVRGERSPMTPIYDYIMSDDVVSEADLLASGLLANATKPVDAAAALIQAKNVSREAVGDVFKAGWGNVEAIQKVTAQFTAARKAFLETEQVQAWIKADIEKPILGGEFNIPSFTEAQALLRQADDQLKRNAAVDENLLRIIKGDFEAGTEFDGLFGTIRDRTSSRFEFLERARVENLKRNTDSYWNLNEYTTPSGYTAKILSWLNRGNLQKEVPSGHIITNERGTQSAFREMSANIRYIQNQTDQSGQWGKNKLSQWSRLTSKKERNDFIEEFEDEAAYLIIKKNVPGTENMTPAQLDLLKLLVKDISVGYRRAKYRELGKTLDNSYHVIDGSENPIYVESMEKLLRSYGIDGEIYRSQIAKRLEGSPLLESDIPAMVQIMDFNTFQTVIKESPERLALLVEKIKNSGLDERGLRSQINLIAKRGDKGAESAAKTKLQVAVDYAVIAADTYNTIWKPLTLMRLGYTQRNIIEGALRIPVAIAALSQELGYQKFAAYRDFFVSKETTDAAIKNIVEFKRTRGGKKKLKRNELEVVAEIDEADNLIRQTTSTLKEFLGQVKGYKKQLGIIKSSRLQDIDNMFDIAITKFSPKNQKELSVLLKKMVDDTASEKERDKALNLLVAKFQNETDVAEFAGFFKFLNDALGKNLEEVNTILATGAKSKARAKAKNIAKYPLTPIEIDLLDKMRTMYKNIIVQNEEIALLQLARASSLDKLDNLVNGATPRYKRIGEDTFEAFDGLVVSDAFAGIIGQFARGNASASKTVRTVVGTNNRDSLFSLFSSRSAAVKVTPDMPEWSASYANYFNTKLHNDEIAVRIAKGESDSDILRWLDSPEAKTYRKNAATGIKEWGGGSRAKFVQAVRVITERNLPDLTAEGLDLRAALVSGNLSPEQALRIPQDLRTTIKGFEFLPGEALSVSGVYQKAVNSFFKYLGSLPEDVFLRHPLYKAIYRNEIRSLGQLAEAQGKEITSELLESLARQAHLRANKVVTETLYTVERFTDPATLFRFASPFWMAQQNSSKFWIGESLKNPRLPALGLLGWNSVNEALTVRDADEYNRRAGGNSLPFNSNEQIWVTLPKGIVKLLGTEDLPVLKISKDSANLILQGSIPLIPGFGAPIQTPANWLVKKLSGTSFDIDKELDKLPGTAGDAIRELLIGPQPKGIEGLLPTTAWSRNAYDWIFAERSPRYWQRVNLIVEKKMLAEHEAGNPVTQKVFLDALKDAQQQARNTFRSGVLFGLTSPVSVQLGTEYELFKSEYRLYNLPVEQGGFGPIEGPIKFEEDYGSTLATYARSSLSYNPAGLLATSETIKNINENKDLFDQIFLIDERVAGAMVNSGTTDDYSPIAAKKLDETRVAGQPLRSKRQDVGGAEKKRQENAGWAEYIKASEYYDAQMEARGIKAGTKAAEPYEAAKRQSAELIGKDFPMWFEQRREGIDLDKTPTVTAIFTVLNNDKFNRSNQAKTPLWEALRYWAEVREEYSNAVQAQGRQQASEAINAAYQETARKITLDYPEFGPFFERYLKQDKLNKVQIRLK